MCKCCGEQQPRHTTHLRCTHTMASAAPLACLLAWWLLTAAAGALVGAAHGRPMHAALVMQQPQHEPQQQDQHQQQEQQQAVMAGTTARSSNVSQTHAAGRLSVFLDHDGHTDDFVTLLLLLSQPHAVQLKGIVVTEGDCFAEVAVNTTFKLLQLLGATHVPVTLSTLPPVNPFPAAWRAHGLSIDVLPLLNQQPQQVEALRRRQLQRAQAGQEWLAQALMAATEPATVVVTGPLSNLAYALSTHPQVAAKIARVWWMGGALRVPGNAGRGGSAEWNAFWDPPALGVLWGSDVPLTLVPLDGTNQVPITPSFVRAFGPQSLSSLRSQLAGTLYAPAVEWVAAQAEPYYAWDVLTASCMLAQQAGERLCTVEADLPVAAVLSGSSQGATRLVDGTLPRPQQQHSQRQGRQPQARPGERLSAVKRVSAVTDVSATLFQAFALRAMAR